MSDKKNDNMKLWNAVCNTNPANTTPVQNGRRQFSAICAQSQVMSATEQFGPYGAAWGLKNIERDFTLLDKYELILFSAVFYYPGGEFEISTSMPIWISKQKGKLDNDIIKKAETDILTKALSKIGFNADVFMGLFDDNRYVQAMTDKFNKPEEPILLTSAQADHLRQLMGKEHLISFFCKQWQIESLESLWADNYNAAIDWIQAEIEANRNSIKKHRAYEKQEKQKRELEQHAATQVHVEVDAAQQAADTVMKAITPAQVQEIRATLENYQGVDEYAFCHRAGINQIGEISSDRYNGAVSWIMQHEPAICPDEEKLNGFIDAAQSVVAKHNRKNSERQQTVINDQPARANGNSHQPTEQRVNNGMLSVWERRDYDRDMFAAMGAG